MRNLSMRATPQKFYILRNKLMRVRAILGIFLINAILKIFFSKKKAEFINTYDRNFQVLLNLILRKRAKFALINSALIHSTLIYSRINLFP